MAVLFYFERSWKNLKKIKSYTGIWNVEKVLYAINDFNLPFPVTFTQITWFVITEFIIILFGDIPPLSMIEGAFLKYFGIPVALTWFMSQKTFDGKKPYSFLKSQITYALRPKITYAGKAVKLQKETFNETITAVRSVKYVPDKIYWQQPCLEQGQWGIRLLWADTVQLFFPIRRAEIYRAWQFPTAYRTVPWG